jgi:hypothetical protein
MDGISALDHTRSQKLLQNGAGQRIQFGFNDQLQRDKTPFKRKCTRVEKFPLIYQQTNELFKQKPC